MLGSCGLCKPDIMFTVKWCKFSQPGAQLDGPVGI